VGLKDQLQQGLGAAAAASERLLATARLRGELSSLRGELEVLYADLGKQTMSLYSRGDLRHPELEEYVDAIDSSCDAIDRVQREIAELEGGRPGDVGGRTVPSASAPVPPAARSASTAALRLKWNPLPTRL